MAQPQARNYDSGVILGLHSVILLAGVSLASLQTGSYHNVMAFTNIAVAEEALSLSATDRVELAKLLIRSLEGDGRTDEEIKAELNCRLENLVSGKDPGLSFEQVFGASS